MDLDGSYREPSGVLMEAAAGLGRPPLGSDTVIPSGQLMRRTVFEPAREHLAGLRARWPIDHRGRLVRAARDRTIPETWPGDPLLPLERIVEPPTPGIMDGWFPPGPFAELPGLTADHPISASALGRLLECPHRFLYERVLGWNAPPELVEEGSIDALSYGSLFHETAERFYRDHGERFCDRASPLEHWKRLASEIADHRFAEFVDTYPLVGDDVRGAQRARLRRDLIALLDADWALAKRFHAVEQAFGPMAIPIGGETVHVRGFIDRIDTIGATTLVRDLKTGRAKPREKPDDLRPAYDVQLGLYGLVARAQSVPWGVPVDIQGAYVYPADASGDERSFVEDFATLAAATEQWVGAATRLLRARRFPRTPIEDDCQFCPFKPVCGPAATTRAEQLMTGAEDLRELAAIKLGDRDE
jgi:RecB family exonuclease